MSKKLTLALSVFKERFSHFSRRVRFDYVVALLTSICSAIFHVFLDTSLVRSGDYRGLHAIYRNYMRDAFNAGEFPFWNPYLALGKPFAADIEAAIFYPMNWIFLIFPESVSLFLTLAIHGFIAVFFLFKIFDYCGVSSVIAYVLGFVYLNSGPLQTRLWGGQLPPFYIYCLMPLILHLILRFKASFSFKDFVLLALGMALVFLAGHPQFYWLLVCGISFFLIGFHCGRDLVASFQAFVLLFTAFFAANIFALVLCGVLTLPFVEYMGQANRFIGSNYASFLGLDFTTLLSFGQVTMPRNWAHQEDNLFIGCILSLSGLFALTMYRDRMVRGFIALFFGALLLGLLADTSFFPVLQNYVPGYGLFRMHVRFGWLASCALIFLGGIYVNELLRQDGRCNKKMQLASFLTFSMCVLYLFFSAHGLHVFSVTVFLSAAFIWTFFVLQDTLRLGVQIRRKVAYLLFAGLFLESIAGICFTRSFAEPDEQTVSVEEKVAAFLKKESMNSGFPPRVVVPAGNGPLVHRFSSFVSFSGLHMRRVWTFLHQYLSIPFPAPIGANWVNGEILRRNLFPYDCLNLEFSYSEKEREIYANSKTDPRFYVAHRFRLTENLYESVEIMKKDKKFWTEAVLEKKYASHIQFEQSNRKTKETRVQLNRFEAHEIHFDIEAAQPGIFVLAESWYPGWEVIIEEQLYETFPVNGWMRGVAIPAGQYRLSFFYNPRIFNIGATLSLLGLVFALLGLRSKRSFFWKSRAAF